MFATPVVSIGDGYASLLMYGAFLVTLTLEDRAQRAAGRLTLFEKGKESS